AGRRWRATRNLACGGALEPAAAEVGGTECAARRSKGLSATSGSHSPRPGSSGLTNNPLRAPIRYTNLWPRRGPCQRLAATYVILIRGCGAPGRSLLGGGLGRGGRHRGRVP